MKKKIDLLIFVGLLLGFLFGILLPNFSKELSFLGTIYVNLLEFMIVPILFTTIMITIYNSKKTKNKIVLKTIITFIIMFMITFLITSLMAIIINLSKGFEYKFVEWTGEISKFSFLEIIINLFPNNLITMFQNNLIFPTILFSIFCGLTFIKVKNGDKVIEIIEGMIFNKMVEL